jgi:hypothetical protein
MAPERAPLRLAAIDWRSSAATNCPITNAGQNAAPGENFSNKKFAREVVPHRPAMEVQYN